MVGVLGNDRLEVDLSDTSSPLQIDHEAKLFFKCTAGRSYPIFRVDTVGEFTECKAGLQTKPLECAESGEVEFSFLTKFGTRKPDTAEGDSLYFISTLDGTGVGLNSYDASYATLGGKCNTGWKVQIDVVDLYAKDVTITVSLGVDTNGNQDDLAALLAEPVADRAAVKTQLAIESSNQDLVQRSIESTDISETYKNGAIVINLQNFRDKDNAAQTLIEAVAGSVGKVISLPTSTGGTLSARVIEVSNKVEDPSKNTDESNSSSSTGLVAGLAAVGVILIAVAVIFVARHQRRRSNTRQPAAGARAVNPAYTSGDTVSPAPNRDIQPNSAHDEADLEANASPAAVTDEVEDEYLDDIERAKKPDTYFEHVGM